MIFLLKKKNNYIYILQKIYTELKEYISLIYRAGTKTTSVTYKYV